MKIYNEKSLSNFKFWGGATFTAEHLKRKELDLIETILEDLYPEGMSETEVNDLFWFEEDTIADWLGYADFEELLKREKEE